jgi:hypothetical protein
LLCSVVHTNDDYGLGTFVLLPGPSPETLAVFKTVELQAPVFFLMHSLVWARGFTDVDPPICVRCLRWNLVAPFSKCNRNCWTRCGCCTYIQHAWCKDIVYRTLSGPCPTANKNKCRRSSCRPSS